jgi:diketogulonate reductase-like aldo/keto reductase
MIAQHIQEPVDLSNGVQMPWFGLGVIQAREGEEVQNAVKRALEAGYRHIDTAALYANECVGADPDNFNF